MQWPNIWTTLTFSASVNSQVAVQNVKKNTNNSFNNKRKRVGSYLWSLIKTLISHGTIACGTVTIDLIVDIKIIGKSSRTRS